MHTTTVLPLLHLALYRLVCRAFSSPFLIVTLRPVTWRNVMLRYVWCRYKEVVEMPLSFEEITNAHTKSTAHQTTTKKWWSYNIIVIYFEYYFTGVVCRAWYFYSFTFAFRHQNTRRKKSTAWQTIKCQENSIVVAIVRFSSILLEYQTTTCYNSVIVIVGPVVLQYVHRISSVLGASK